jgi:hypothetical protein
MRLLTTACCTFTFISIPGLTALANPINHNILELSRKSDLVNCDQLTNNAASLAQTTIQANKDTIDSEATRNSTSVDEAEVQEILSELDEIKNAKPRSSGGSPGITVVNPYGFGADGNRFYLGSSFQSALRFNQSDVDFGLGFGGGFGNARKAVGLELGYALAAFGRDRDFGSGGFNVKLHRQLNPSTALAVGWNGFLNIGDGNDFQDSVYGVVTKIFRTREDINSAFSRVAISGGIGSGGFQEDGDGAAVFGGLAIRAAKPLSLITEWTGQDLAIGMSIAPFKNLPITITPAFRDIAGAGDGARFVLGTGIGFSF